MTSRPARWFRLVDERQVGPCGLEDMRALVLEGALGPDDYVWADGMPEWLPAGEVPALIPPRGLREGLPAWSAQAG